MKTFNQHLKSSRFLFWNLKSENSLNSSKIRSKSIDSSSLKWSDRFSHLFRGNKINCNLGVGYFLAYFLPTWPLFLYINKKRKALTLFFFLSLMSISTVIHTVTSCWDLNNELEFWNSLVTKDFNKFNLFYDVLIQ